MNFLRCFIVVAAACAGVDLYAVQAPNPRASSATVQNARDTDSSTIARGTVSRSTTPPRSAAIPSSARGAVVSKAARGASTVARSASSATVSRGGGVRSATNTARSATTPNVARSGVARATAIYSDVSKIGGGYAACRESYATCMDQFCANANDTYRRCFCSSRFADFRNTENALDEAKTLLMRFEDNNLNAVDKTAAEVNAMYSATVGEAAIKNDTSGAAKLLDEIGDLLSGRKKASTSNTSLVSLGVLSFDFSDDVDDIWSNGDGSSMFSSGGQNLAELEGVNLYNAANKQCMNVVSGSCDNSAIANMARSSYSILITQDCNAYQKNIDKKVESVKQTVRTAEKYLREARLEEYRSHNSADVNECITKVRAALTTDTACGANYKRCLDYTGAYINQSTGDPIYSPRLFKLTELINLDGESADVLKQNEQFNKFLESRKLFAAKALDTCRDISQTVWDEFKRVALIEIAQAQDEKLEEVRMSCVGTMADCYDTQSSALKDFDNTTAQMVGALSAYAAKQMCMEKVSACAALYGNDEPCTFDSKSGKLLNSTACGLGALIKFVDSVDNIRIAEGCETALHNYATELCTPSTGSDGYPWKCRLLSPQQIQNNITEMAKTYCNTDVVKYDNATVRNIINDIVDDITLEISEKMADECESIDGEWYDSSESEGKTDYNETFYRNVFGTTGPRKDNDNNVINSYGVCGQKSVKIQCENLDEATGGFGWVKYNAERKTCTLSTEWYQYKCENTMKGYWEGNVCYTGVDK